MAYKFNPFTGKLDETGSGSPGAPGVGVPAAGTTGQVLTKNSGTDYDTGWSDFEKPLVEVFTVSAPQAAAKEVVLAQTAIAGSTVVLHGGIGQTPASDFSVAGATVSWSALGMDSIPVAAGDILIIMYRY